jgi:hypothetical protein
MFDKLAVLDRKANSIYSEIINANSYRQRNFENFTRSDLKHQLAEYNKEMDWWSEVMKFYEFESFPVEKFRNDGIEHIKQYKNEILTLIAIRLLEFSLELIKEWISKASKITSISPQIIEGVLFDQLESDSKVTDPAIQCALAMHQRNREIITAQIKAATKFSMTFQ